MAIQNQNNFLYNGFRVTVTAPPDAAGNVTFTLAIEAVAHPRTLPWFPPSVLVQESLIRNGNAPGAGRTGWAFFRADLTVGWPRAERTVGPYWDGTQANVQNVVTRNWDVSHSVQPTVAEFSHYTIVNWFDPASTSPVWRPVNWANRFDAFPHEDVAPIGTTPSPTSYVDPNAQTALSRGTIALGPADWRAGGLTQIGKWPDGLPATDAHTEHTAHLLTLHAVVTLQDPATGEPVKDANGLPKLLVVPLHAPQVVADFGLSVQKAGLNRDKAGPRPNGKDLEFGGAFQLQLSDAWLQERCPELTLAKKKPAKKPK